MQFPSTCHSFNPSFLSVPSQLPSYTISVFCSYILTSWSVEAFLKPQHSIFQSPPAAQIETFQHYLMSQRLDYLMSQRLMNTCLLEVSESLPTERRHTQYHNQFQIPKCMPSSDRCRLVHICILLAVAIIKWVTHNWDFLFIGNCSKRVFLESIK